MYYRTLLKILASQIPLSKGLKYRFITKLLIEINILKSFSVLFTLN